MVCARTHSYIRSEFLTDSSQLTFRTRISFSWLDTNQAVNASIDFKADTYTYGIDIRTNSSEVAAPGELWWTQVSGPFMSSMTLQEVRGRNAWWEYASSVFD